MKRVLFTLFLILTATLVCSAQTIYFPHVSNGVQSANAIWKTTILLTNPASSGSASGSVTFTKENAVLSGAGTAFNLSFRDENGTPVSVGNTIPFQIAAGQSRKFVSDGSGPLESGFATVSS